MHHSTDGATVQLHLFGGPRFFVRGDPVHVPAQASVAAAVTAAHGERGVSQGTLLRLLWRSGTENVLRGRLNQTLYDLKQHLDGAPLLNQRDGRCFIDLELVATDLDRFHLLLADLCIEEAARLAEKGFMSELDRSFSPDLEQWIRQKQTWLKGQLRAVAAKLWEDGASTGAWNIAETAAEVLVAVFPRDERYLRKLMVAQAAQGQVDAARIAYDHFAESIRTIHPNWQPSESIRKTLASLSQTARRHLVPSRNLPCGPVTSNLPLVGREKEVRKIRAALEAPPRDGLQVLTVIGQAGSGKTRIVNEALTLSGVAEEFIWTLRCTQDRSQLPYSGLMALMEERQRFKHTSMVSPASMTHPGPHTPKAVQSRFTEWFWDQATSASHLVIFIDDAQWLDSHTRGELALLLAKALDWPLTLIMTGRALRSVPLLGEPSIKEGLASDTWLELGPLAPSHLVTLRDIIVSRVGAAGLEMYSDLTAGILASLMLWSGNLSAGLIHVHDLLRESHNTTRGCTAKLVAESLGAQIRKRLKDLSSLAAEALSLLVALEREASIRELAEFLGVDAALVVSGVQELVGLGLVEWGSDRMLGLSSPMASGIRAAISTSSSVLAHHRIAEQLIKKHSRDDTPRLAVHLFRSGRYSEAKSLALEAAESSQMQGHVQAAIRILKPLADLDAHGDHGLQATLRLGELSILSGNGRDAGRLFTRALEEAKRQRDRPAALRAQLGHLSIKVLSDTGPSPGVVRDLHRLKDLALRLGVDDLIPDVVELILRAQARRGDAEGVRSTLADIPGLERRLDDRLGARLRTLGSLESLYDPGGSRPSLAAEILEGAYADGDDDLGLRAANWLLIRGIQYGTLQSKEGLSLRREAARLASNSKELTERAKLEANTAVWYLDSGDFAGASVALQRAKRLMGDCALPEAEANLLVNMGELALADGRPSAALDHFLKARDLVEGDDLPASLYARAGSALAHLGSGRIHEAGELLATLPAGQRVHPFDSSFLALARSRVLAARGRKEEANEVLYAEALELKGRFKLGWVRVELERFRLSRGSGIDLEELEDFLVRRDLRRLLGQLRVARMTEG